MTVVAWSSAYRSNAAGAGTTESWRMGLVPLTGVARRRRTVSDDGGPGCAVERSGGWVSDR
ncbi:hypothetical protein GCM10027215_24120 [Nocardioides zeae]